MRNMFVANRMTKNPITVEPTTPVNDAAKLMKQRKIRRLPVVEKGRLVGIISDRDVMRVAPSPATTLSKFEIMSLLDKMTVSEIMAKEVVSLPDTATIEEAALVMYNERLSGLPVVSSMGAVVGIITETDVFKHLSLRLCSLIISKRNMTKFNISFYICQLSCSWLISYLRFGIENIKHPFSC